MQQSNMHLEITLQSEWRLEWKVNYKLQSVQSSGYIMMLSKGLIPKCLYDNNYFQVIELLLFSQNRSIICTSFLNFNQWYFLMDLKGVEFYLMNGYDNISVQSNQEVTHSILLWFLLIPQLGWLPLGATWGRTFHLSESVAIILGVISQLMRVNTMSYHGYTAIPNNPVKYSTAPWFQIFKPGAKPMVYWYSRGMFLPYHLCPHAAGVSLLSHWDGRRLVTAAAVQSGGFPPWRLVPLCGHWAAGSGMGLVEVGTFLWKWKGWVQQ